ncbi:MAG: hypothetical protein AB9842_07910 [Bacteroidales bacterium]
MLRIRTFNDYYQGCLEKIPGLKQCILVSTEAELGQRIRDLADEQFPLLVVVIPSTDTIAIGVDNVISANTCLLYVLQKTDITTTDPDAFLDLMELSQDLLREIIARMIADRFDANGHCQLMSRLDLNRMHIDPEYNYYGCNGWSLSFTLQTASY